MKKFFNKITLVDILAVLIYGTLAALASFQFIAICLNYDMLADTLIIIPFGILAAILCALEIGTISKILDK